MLSVPSVAMIGGTPPQAMISPLKLPSTAPSAMPSGTPAAAGQCRERHDGEGDHHRRQPDRRADRQVNAARDDDHHLGQGDDHQDRDVQQDIAEVVDGQEGRAAQAHQRR